MQNEFTESTDYTKLYRFVQDISIIESDLVSDNEFGKNVLSSISNIFGFTKSTFWMLNSESHTYYPVSYRIDRSLIEEYQRKYYELDPFYPDNFQKRGINGNVISIDDLMANDDYYASTYFNKFLSPADLYYYVVMYLRHKGNIIGGVALLRSKSEGNFTVGDMNLMRIAETYISSLTFRYMTVSGLKDGYNMYEALYNQSPVGLIIFSRQHPYSIRYLNSAAWRYTSDLVNDNCRGNHAEQFIKKHILGNMDFEQFGLHKNTLSGSNKKYALVVSPCQTTGKNNSMIYVYIIPQIEPPDIKQLFTPGKIPGLTGRQREIAEYVLQGCTNKEIADKMFITVSTVKTHLNNIYKELKVSNRLGLYRKFTGNIQT